MLSKGFLTISLVVTLISMTSLVVAPMISMYSGENNNSSSDAYAQSSQALPTYFIRIHPSTFEEDVTHYDPGVAAVPSGTTVVWVNDDLFVPHTVTSGGPDDPDAGTLFDSGEMPFGAKFQLTFDDSSGLIGKFPYYCTLHPWITGTISADDTVARGESFEFKSGTGPTLNVTENSRTLLAFTPVGVQVNQEVQPFFYNFSITRDSDNKTLFAKQFDVENNDFEIEVIHFAGIRQLGPEGTSIWFGPEVYIPYTGAYHVAGDFFTETGNYTLTVELTRIGSTPPEQQMRDEFDIQVVS